MVKNSQFVETYSESGSNEEKPYSPGVFNFGKYKNRKIEEIFEEDKAYCQWYVANVDDSSKHKVYVKTKLNNLFDN